MRAHLCSNPTPAPSLSHPSSPPTSLPQVAASDALTLALRLWGLLPEDVLSMCRLLPRGVPRDARPVPKTFATADVDAHPAAAASAFLDPAHLRSSAVYPLRAAAIVAPRVHTSWLTVLALLFPGFRAAHGRGRADKGAGGTSSSAPADDTQLAAFFEEAVDVGLLTSSTSHDRHILGLNVAQVALGRCTAAQVGIILSRRLLAVTAANASDRAAYLNAASRAFIARLRSVAIRAQEGGDGALLLAVVSALQGHGGRGFDAAAKSAVTAELLGCVGETELSAYLGRLQERFMVEGEAAAEAEAAGPSGNVGANDAVQSGDDGAEAAAVAAVAHGDAEPGAAHRRAQIWTLDQMIAVTRMVAAPGDATTRTLAFAMAHGVLQADTPVPRSLIRAFPETAGLPRACGTPAVVREACVSRALQLIAEAGEIPDPGLCGRRGKKGGEGDKNVGGQDTGGVTAPSDRPGAPAWRQAKETREMAKLGAVSDAIALADAGRRAKGVALVCPTGLGDDLARCIDDLRAASATLRRAGDRTGDGKGKDQRCVALAWLADLLALYSMGKPERADLSAGADLLGMAQAVLGEGPAPAEGQPGWTEVLADLSLSVLSRRYAPLPSAPLRAAVETAFSACARDMTEPAMTALVRVVRRPLTPEGNGAGSSDESDSDAGSDDGPDDDDDENDGGSDENGAEEHSHDTATNERALDAALDKQLRGVVGEVGSDDEASSLPDADDDDMFRMDGALSAMVRQAKERQRGDVETRRDLLTLKFRAVALLDAYLAHAPASPACFALVRPLLAALRAAAMPSGDAALAQRLKTLLIERLSRAKAASGATASDDERAATLGACLAASGRAPSPNVHSVVAPAAERLCLYTLRVLTWASDGAAPRANGVALAVDHLGRALKQHFRSKRSFLRHSLLAGILRESCPEAGAPLLPTLVAEAGGGRNQSKRAEALDLVCEVVSRNPKVYAAATGAALVPLLPDLTLALTAVAEGSAFPARQARARALKASCDIVAKLQTVYRREGASLTVEQAAMIAAACSRGEGGGKVKDLVRRLAKLVAPGGHKHGEGDGKNGSSCGGGGGKLSTALDKRKSGMDEERKRVRPDEGGKGGGRGTTSSKVERRAAKKAATRAAATTI